MAFIVYMCAGFLSGLIGGMGMGGGTIMIPALTIFLGVPQHEAQLTNLLSFLPMAAISLPIHRRQGLIRTEGLLPLIIPAAVTSALSALLALVLPSDILKKLFGVFLITLAVKTALSSVGKNAQ